MKQAKGPTLRQLELLLVVYRVQSLGAAARELGISQPAMSRAARALERLCGFEIFDRGFYHTYVSREGDTMATQAQRVLDEYGRLLQMIAKIAQRLERMDRRSAKLSCP